MAKSTAEQIRELTREVDILRERDATRERDLQRLESKLDAEHDARHKLEVELADPKRQLQDHLAQYQEWDKRRWGLIVVLIGAVLSLPSGLIVSSTRK